MTLSLTGELLTRGLERFVGRSLRGRQLSTGSSVRNQSLISTLHAKLIIYFRFMHVLQQYQ